MAKVKVSEIEAILSRIAELEASRIELKTRLVRLEQALRDRTSAELSMPGYLEADSIERQVASIIDLVAAGYPFMVKVRSQSHAELLSLALVEAGIDLDKVAMEIDPGERRG